MKIAISIHNGRVAPVFDVSSSAMIVFFNAAQAEEQMIVALPMESAIKKIKLLADLEVDSLICGAITQAVYEVANSCDMQVHSFIAGSVDEVLLAFTKGLLKQEKFDMPGCGLQRRRRYRNCPWKKKKGE